MSLQDEISNVIEGEVCRRVQKQLNDYIHTISKTHGISIELLLRDLPVNVYSMGDNITCRGMKIDGKRCTRKGKFNGYCANHVHQKKRVEPVEIKRSNTHTHSLCLSFVEGCPACESSTKRLIDLNSMLCNE
jgi:hypothetical protein